MPDAPSVSLRRALTCCSSGEPFLPVPQAAQQIIELQEAAQINAGLQPTNLGRNNSLHDMKTVVKTWRNRLPIVSDDLSHWSSVFMWRQHHYQGKPAWSSMHSSCNFPDTPLFWFHVLVVCFFFFFYQIFHFLAGMVVGGWYDEGKEEGGERWEAFPAPCSLVPAEQTCCWTLPAAPGAQAPGIRALGCGPFVSKPP